MSMRVIDGTLRDGSDMQKTPFQKELRSLHANQILRARVIKRLYTNIAEYAEDPVGTRHEKASPVSGHKGLFEARSQSEGMIFRMLFDFDGSQPRALCAFQKKSQSLPRTHVAHAAERSKWRPGR